MGDYNTYCGDDECAHITAAHAPYDQDPPCEVAGCPCKGLFEIISAREHVRRVEAGIRLPFGCPEIDP